MTATELLEAAMENAYDWIGECMDRGFQPERLEVDARIVQYIVSHEHLTKKEPK